MSNVDEVLYARNIGLFGVDGQRRLQQTAVTVVGLGGLGSHVVQQLAYLGTRQFVLIDPDLVERSNLNRLIGAHPDDVGDYKVEIARRMIQTISPEASINSFPRTVGHDETHQSITQTACVLGCVDNDFTRLRLTEFTSQHQIPYFDLASDTGLADGGVWFGGRVFSSLNGDRCLSCAQELDQQELAVSSMTDAQRSNHDAIYGVPSDALNGSGPMVVSINGVVASLGVTEFSAWASGLRPPKGHLVYRGDHGTVTLRVDERSGSCYYCDVLWRRGR